MARIAKCPKQDELAQILKERSTGACGGYRAILDLVEIAELHCVNRVSIVFDKRTHGDTSLVHPCLASLQGPAIVVCFHNVALEIDAIVELTSPSIYCFSNVSGGGGCGGAGFPRFGTGICGAFQLTDCVQILVGKSLLFFDPSAEFFVQGSKKRPHKGQTPAGKIYGLSQEFSSQFPDQLEPFYSISMGAKEAICTATDPFFRGTLFRLPLRTKNGPTTGICDMVYDDATTSSLMKELQTQAPKSFLFTYHLQSISIDECLPSGSGSLHPVLRSQTSSSPISRRSHLDQLVSNKDWIEGGSRFSKAFKGSWFPVRSSYTLQITHNHGHDDVETVDTYVIQAVLAPNLLRKLANTAPMKTLNLVPAVAIAAHVHSGNSETGSSASNSKPPDGTIFVGLDTGIKTGLPFIINAPLFLHELRGTVLLTEEDDEDILKLYRGVRKVKVRGKNGSETRSLALYVWNRQALASAIKELIPSMLKDLRDPLRLMYGRDPRLLYRFWPYHSRIRSDFQDFVKKYLYIDLTKPDSSIFLTEKQGFLRMDQGFFPSQDYSASGLVTRFFWKRMSMFTVPFAVADDLNRFGIAEHLAPCLARRVLREQEEHAQWLANCPDDALEILEYCLADLVSVESIENNEKALNICRLELKGLCLMPLADGSVGTIGTSLIVASAEQQGLLPSLKSKFLSIHAERRLRSFLNKPGFLENIGLVEFGPQILADHISTVLPSGWKGEDFVSWNGAANANEPSPLWIFRFWKQVRIWNHDEVRLFRCWPLIPTKMGQLASCGHARHILFFYAASGDESLHRSLSDEFSAMMNEYEEQEKREIACESRPSPTAVDADFWNMGKSENTKVVVDDTEEMGSDDSKVDGNEETNNGEVDRSEGARGEYPTASVIAAPLPVAETPLDAPSNGNFTTTNEIQHSVSIDTVHPPHESSCLSICSLHHILEKLCCPLLECSFFSKSDTSKMLPSDRLSLSRCVLVTLNQWSNCCDSFHSWNDALRLRWAELAPEECDELVLLLTKDEGLRLSFMASDLTLLRSLPIFETISGERVSLNEHEGHFGLESSVDLDSLTTCLPESLKAKFIVKKHEIEDILEDLGVRKMNESSILQKVILPEFPRMRFAQKEAVCSAIYRMWEQICESHEFMDALKKTPFVKRAGTDGGEVVFVRANQLLDPRNLFFQFMHDESSPRFPTREFWGEEWLVILSQLGLKRLVDNDTFLECACIVEAEASTVKAVKLHEYYKEHYGEMLDCTQSFTRELSEIKCVPAELDGAPLALYNYKDVAVPKDRNLIFKVVPVIPDGFAPPEVMFSSLGIMSPPSIGSVLRHFRELTNEGSLDHWNYQFGNVEAVFASLFSFLQENYEKLSPRQQNMFHDQPIVPVGTMLVRANRLFFHLGKDIAPFFFEVPRAFGAYDELLRELGVRDSPTAEDYCLSLLQLKQDLGDRRMNVNELQSVIEVINLVSKEDRLDSPFQDKLLAPDSRGVLFKTPLLFQNDRPWLINAGRLDLDLIHLAHPKLSLERCEQLHIGRLSDHVSELLEDGFVPSPTDVVHASTASIESVLKSDLFISTIENASEKAPPSCCRARDRLHKFRVVHVTNLKTRFVLARSGAAGGVDVTLDAASFCFIDQSIIYVSELPQGLSTELVVAAAICDAFIVDRKHVACLSAMLASDQGSISMISKTLGLTSVDGMEELRRGEPGQPLAKADRELVGYRPSKVFLEGEIVAIRKGANSNHLVYGIVVACESGISLSHVRVRVEREKEMDFPPAEVFSLLDGLQD